MKGDGTKTVRKRAKVAPVNQSEYLRTLAKAEELELQNQFLLQSQMELELSRDQYADFFDTAPVCFVTLTPSGMIREINLPAARLLEGQKHFVGWPFINFIANEDRKIFLAHLSNCRRNSDTTHPLSVEMKLKRKPEEDLVYIKLISTPVHTKGAAMVYKSIFINVTEEKLAEKKLQQSLERERAAREAAEAADRAKDNFLAALSHELRTPLNPVLLVASEAATNRELPPGVRASFDMIRRNVELEARLIDDLLDLTRVTAGKLKFEKHHVNVHAILKNTIALLQSEIDQKRIKLKQNFAAFQTIISGDGVRLQQIFCNVLKNAVKFTPAEGTISVETASTGKEFSVSISDSGIGMTAEELRRAFEIFTQGEHAKHPHRFGGLGLGLTICKKLVELHDGKIDASSKGRNQGATISIKFPLAELNREAKRSQVAVGPTRHLSPTSRARILLVEDHEPTRVTLASLLSRRRHNVKMAISVTEALALAAKNDFDVVISDIGLPDGNGFDLFKKLRKQSPVKGIALTGYGTDDDIARSREAGFSTHLTKPVHIELLDNALTTALKD
jgi:signal transduction histidine kinase